MISPPINHATETNGAIGSGTPSNPQPFWDRVAPRYAAKPVADEPSYLRKLAITRNYLTADAAVLEIGCGTGSTAIAHAPYVAHVRATDVSERMIAIAKSKPSQRKLQNLEFVQESHQQAMATAEKFNVILALSVLHLLPDWQETIAAAAQSLEDGGVLVTSTPCLRDTHPWLRWLALPCAKLGLMPPLSFFSKDALRGALQRSGFELVEEWQPRSKAAVFIVARRSS